MGTLAVQPRLMGVLFYDRSDHWSRALLTPGFRHVELVIQSPGGNWLAVVGKVGGLIDVLELGPAFDPRAHARAHGARLLLRHESYARRRVWPFSLLSCVGIVKAVMGIRGWALTPWQLYRRLSRDG